MRALTPAMTAELSAASIRWALLYQGMFLTTQLNLWSGIGDLVFDGVTYLGNGWLVGVSPVTETTEVRSEGMQISLTGVPLDLLEIVISEGRQGKLGMLYLVFLDPNGNLINAPYMTFCGFFDSASIERRPDGADIIINYESRLADLDRPHETRYTDASQKSRYAEDRGFEYVQSLEDWDGFWGDIVSTLNTAHLRRDRR